jgi:hypothetical protein
MFLALVAGTFTGMGITLLFLIANNKESKPKEKDLRQKRTASPPIQKEPEHKELPEVPLTRKIPSKDFSIADFNCAADGVNEEEHIASRQQRQDSAYNALKRKKKK